MSILFESIVEWCIYANGAMMTLLSQYFNQTGFSAVELGMLLAVGPIVSLFSNPFWFKVRARIGSKQSISIITLVSGSLIWSLFVFKTFYLALLSMLLITFFMAPVGPIVEAHVMAALMKKGQSFDYPRLWGTIGFTCTALIAGFLFRLGFYILFLGVSLALLLSFLFSLKLDSPVVTSTVAHKSSGTGRWEIFMFMLVAGSVAFSLTSFCSAFVPVLISQRGYDIATAGTCFAVMGCAEVPFLFFAGKILKKIGNLPLLASGVLMTGFRTLLTPLTTSPTTLVLVHVLSGWNYIVMYYALWNYIHYHLPESQSIKAQTLLWTLMSVSCITGTFGGGYLVDHFGLARTYQWLGMWLILFAIPLFMYSVLTKAKPQLLNA